MRVIIFSAGRGTFLDYNGFFGWSFFSGDSGDIPAMVKARQTAQTFASEAEAMAFIERIGGFDDVDTGEPIHSEPFPSDLAFVQVDTDAEYASVEVCVAAGVPRWDSSNPALAGSSRSGLLATEAAAPFNFNFHSGAVGHSLVIGLPRATKSTYHPFLFSSSPK